MPPFDLSRTEIILFSVLFILLAVSGCVGADIPQERPSQSEARHTQPSARMQVKTPRCETGVVRWRNPDGTHGILACDYC